MGFWFQLTLISPCKKKFLNIGYGMDMPDKDDLPVPLAAVTSKTLNSTLFVNIMWKIKFGFAVGIEFMHMVTEYDNAGVVTEYTNERVQLITMVKF